MPRKRINDPQYRVYMSLRRRGMTQVTSAAKAGFTERSGRTLEKRGMAPSKREKKKWNRRYDPLVGVWEEIIVPLSDGDQYFRTLTGSLSRAIPKQAFKVFTEKNQRMEGAAWS